LAVFVLITPFAIVLFYDAGIVTLFDLLGDIPTTAIALEGCKERRSFRCLGFLGPQ
jgi:hypothetical protein